MKIINTEILSGGSHLSHLLYDSIIYKGDGEVIFLYGTVKFVTFGDVRLNELLLTPGVEHVLTFPMPNHKEESPEMYLTIYDDVSAVLFRSLQKYVDHPISTTSVPPVPETRTELEEMIQMAIERMYGQRNDEDQEQTPGQLSELINSNDDDDFDLDVPLDEDLIVDLDDGGDVVDLDVPVQEPVEEPEQSQAPVPAEEQDQPESEGADAPEA